MESTQAEWQELAGLVQGIVRDAAALKAKYGAAHTAPVSYCAVFCQDEMEFARWNRGASSVGVVANDTQTGPVYVVPTVVTDGGPLRVVKVRRPDASRTERGDADFAVPDYEALKSTILGTPGVSLIVREEFEMIELMDSDSSVRVYFSNPPVEEHDGIRQALAAWAH